MIHTHCSDTIVYESFSKTEYNDRFMNFDDARAKCKTKGAHLSRCEEDEFTRMKKIIPGYEVWCDFTRRNDGQFYNSNDTSISQYNVTWYYGKPIDNDDYDCTVVNTWDSSPKLYNIKCDYKRSFICSTSTGEHLIHNYTCNTRLYTLKGNAFIVLT